MTFTNLDSLNTFEFFNTDLCEPADPGFQTWLQNVPQVRSTNVVCTATATEDISVHPTEFTLSPSYPNPFYQATRIRYAVPQSAPVRLTVYDALGRVVAVLVEANQPAGWHEVTFEAGALPSGVYMYRLEAGVFQEMRQMILLK